MTLHGREVQRGLPHVVRRLHVRAASEHIAGATSGMPCPAYTSGIRVRLTDNNGYWARLMLHNVGGAGTVSAVSMVDSSGASVAGGPTEGA